MIKFQGIKREPFRLDLVPMINVVFLLLIFFMLTSTFIQSKADIDLPEAISANEISRQNLILKVGKNGDLELDDKDVNTESLFAELEKKFALNRKVILEIQADKIIKFELFGKLIGIAKQAGIEEFIFTTKALKEQGL